MKAPGVDNQMERQYAITPAGSRRPDPRVFYAPEYYRISVFPLYEQIVAVLFMGSSQIL